MELEHGWYLPLDDLFDLMPNSELFERIYTENKALFDSAAGSSHNHQAWNGGYIDHVQEVMNIACQQYRWMSRARRLPFSLPEALEVLYLHDIEKPWKYATGKDHVQDAVIIATQDYRNLPVKTKAERVAFRDAVIDHYQIQLNDDQKNALRYVEGVRDNEYTPGDRTMGELAAFCHTCDLLSARMWHDQGHNVPTGSDRWD